MFEIKTFESWQMLAEEPGPVRLKVTAGGEDGYPMLT